MFQFKFSSFQDFVFMSGHGVYVWTCLGVTLGFYIFLILRPLYLKKKMLQNIAAQLRIKEQFAVKHHNGNN